jgi:hypothetical protein
MDTMPYLVRILYAHGTIDVPCATAEEAETIKCDALADGYRVTMSRSQIVWQPSAGRGYVIGGVEGFQPSEE